MQQPAVEMDPRLLESRHYIEQQILGAALYDQTLAPQIVQGLSVDHFVVAQHRNLFKMIQWLAGKHQPIDTVSIATNFSKNLPHVGGLDYIGQIASSVFTTADLDHKLRKLVELHARQKLAQLLEETKQIISDPAAGEFEEILDDFERKSLEIRPKKPEDNGAIDSIVNWYENIVLKTQDPSRAYGIMTGWDELDRLTLGFQRSDLIVVGARTSIGKSAFANEIKLRASKRGHKVADFSLEMNKPQLYNRMVANMAKIPMQAMRTGSLTQAHLDLIAGCMDEIRKIHIDDTRGITAEYITSEMRRLKRQEGLDLVVIDYLQEIVEPQERNDNSGSALHRVCQKIRTAAKECDCAVVGLSQLKQEVDNRQNKRPFISDLSGSASISAVADAIILLYRDDYYNPDTPDRGILEVNLAKQRNGPTGLVKLLYDKDYQRITSRTGRPV